MHYATLMRRLVWLVLFASVFPVTSAVLTHLRRRDTAGAHEVRCTPEMTLVSFRETAESAYLEAARLLQMWKPTSGVMPSFEIVASDADPPVDAIIERPLARYDPAGRRIDVYYSAWQLWDRAASGVPLSSGLKWTFVHEFGHWLSSMSTGFAEYVARNESERPDHVVVASEGYAQWVAQQVAASATLEREWDAFLRSWIRTDPVSYDMLPSAKDADTSLVERYVGGLRWMQELSIESGRDPLESFPRPRVTGWSPSAAPAVGAEPDVMGAISNVLEVALGVRAKGSARSVGKAAVLVETGSVWSPEAQSAATALLRGFDWSATDASATVGVSAREFDSGAAAESYCEARSGWGVRRVESPLSVWARSGIRTWVGLDLGRPVRMLRMSAGSKAYGNHETRDEFIVLDGKVALIIVEVSRSGRPRVEQDKRVATAIAGVLSVLLESRLSESGDSLQTEVPSFVSGLQAMCLLEVTKGRLRAVCDIGMSGTAWIPKWISRADLTLVCVQVRGDALHVVVLPGADLRISELDRAYRRVRSQTVASVDVEPLEEYAHRGLMVSLLGDGHFSAYSFGHFAAVCGPVRHVTVASEGEHDIALSLRHCGEVGSEVVLPYRRRQQWPESAVKIQRQVAVMLVICDPEGRRLPMVRVDVEQHRDRLGVRSLASVETGADGTVVVSGLDPASAVRYIVRPRRGQYGLGVTRTPFAPPSDLQVTCTKGAALNLTLDDPRAEARVCELETEDGMRLHAVIRGKAAEFIGVPWGEVRARLNAVDGSVLRSVPEAIRVTGEGGTYHLQVLE